jgi:hypothetical protein
MAKRFDGSWRGASGAMRCTVGDISLTGCYVHGLASPAKGEKTVVSITFRPGVSIDLSGMVVYTDAGMGFAVQFEDLADAAAKRLTTLLQEYHAQAAIA